MIKNEDLQNGYSICFNSWLFDERIQNELRLLLLISSLCAKEGYCYAGNDYLSEKLNKSTDTISAGITKLRKLGYIEVENKKFGAVTIDRKIKLLALGRANQTPTEKMPTANGKNTDADGKNADADGKNTHSPYNVCVRNNNTNQEKYKLLKIQTNKNTNYKNLNPLPPLGENDFNLPHFLDPKVWSDYLKYKKERKEKLSPKGIEMKFSEWSKWSDEGIDVNACIKEAMANEWQGVFKPKQQTKQELNSFNANDARRFGADMRYFNQSTKQTVDISLEHSQGVRIIGARQ
ncbi:helix-turn-helix domain-containing protein [Campylobacter sp. faydin G-105]|uniref:helix-turn-helix domain-containing protein n=1 Tax=Campylobacter anatolicus TaxID=2829105 RepID=UPI001B9A02E3|nr:helix-turn-helix domain-containing protein [Campylobacter anatolicus]MBR8461495.1 helix-turn-helix domain-containing protein [Campylobacter anatolicus]